MKSESINEFDSNRCSNLEESVLEEKTPNKQLRKIDWHIVKRLVVFLYYNNKMKRTSLATRCNMGYDKCILYLDWMRIMDLIRKEQDNEGYELISLNEKGMEIYEKNFKDIL